MNLPADFEVLLQETGMRFVPPEGFTPIAVLPNPAWAYHHAVLSSTRNLEIRYRIDSLSRLAAQRTRLQQGLADAANADINQLYRASAPSTLFNLSGKLDCPLCPFPAEAIRADFGADWGAIADFTIPQHGDCNNFRVGVLIVLHRDNCADAYILGLLREPGIEFELLMNNIYSLSFN